MRDQMTSETLADMVAQGDGATFKSLVLRHQNQVLSLCHRILGDRQRSEDIAQEVFLKAWQAANTYQQKAKFTTWLYRITVNLCRDEIKSRQRWGWLRYLHLYPASKQEETEKQIDESPTAEEHEVYPFPVKIRLSR
jgi:RNA polymerase sigma factor (sigma-70 family)